MLLDYATSVVDYLERARTILLKQSRFNAEKNAFGYKNFQIPCREKKGSYGNSSIAPK